MTFCDKLDLIFLATSARTLIPTAFSLHRNYAVTAVLIESDVKLVDVDLAYVLDSDAAVILQAISRQAQECVDEPVISNDSWRLLIGERISAN